MSNISTSGISPENPDSSMIVKIAWGAAMALLSWIMMVHGRIDGIRMLSSMGGWLAMLLCLGVAIAAVRVAANPARFDVFHKDYSMKPSHSEVEQ
jgi:choline-glycine betaine transporter